MRKNKIILIFIISCFIFILLSNITGRKTQQTTTNTDISVESEYISQSSYSNEIKIDNFLEAPYELILELNEYEIWYANNNTDHFLYIITPFNFTNEIVKLKNNDVSYVFSLLSPLDNAFIKTAIYENTVEIQIDREIIGNTFIIEIETYSFGLTVFPEVKSSSPSVTQILYLEEEDEEEEEEATEAPSLYSLFLDFGVWIKNNSWFLSFFSFYVMCVIYRTFQKPYVFYKNKNGKHKYLGRFSHEFSSEELPGWYELYFKRFRTAKMVYSKISFAEQKSRFSYLNIGLFVYFADIIYHNIKVPEDAIMYEQERVKSFGNGLKYFLYRTVSILIPGVYLSTKLHSTVNYKDKVEMVDTDEVKKIDKNTGEPIFYQKPKLDKKGQEIPIRITKIAIVQHQLMLDKISVICDVKYKIKKTSEKGENEVPETELKKDLYYVKDLEKDEKVSDVKCSNYDISIHPEYDIEEAIMRQNYIDNIKSISDLKIARYNKNYIELDKKYNATRNQLENINRHINSIINDKVQELYNKTIVDENTIIEIVSTALRGYKESGDVKTAALQAFREYHERKDIKKIGDFKMKYELEKTKTKLLENQLKNAKKNPFLLNFEKEELEPDFEMD